MRKHWESKFYTILNRVVQLKWAYSKMKTPGVWTFNRKHERHSFYFALTKVRYKVHYVGAEERLKGEYENLYAHMLMAGPLMIMVSEKIH